MTFIEAALFILNKNGNSPMSPKEIWLEIEKLNLVNSSGKTPAATLCTQILLHTKNSPIKTEDFVKKNPKNKIFFEFDELSKQNKFRLIDNVKVAPVISALPIVNNPTPLPSNGSLVYQITCKEINWQKLSIYLDNSRVIYELGPCLGFTYLVEDSARNTIKIGHTDKQDPRLRLSELATANPNINMIHVFPHSQFSEAFLHSKFDDCRSKLEWFFRVKSLDIFIKTEIDKHNKIIKTFNKQQEVLPLEKELIKLFK